MSPPVYDMTAALGAIALLRHIANHIERSGPSAMLHGTLSLDTESRPVSIAEFGDGSSRTAAAAAKAIAGSKVYVLNADFTFGHSKSYAPSFGIRQVGCEGELYRWDGSPPRPPKKGEFYLHSDAPTWVSRAGRDLKRPKHIMTLCT